MTSTPIDLGQFLVQIEQSLQAGSKLIQALQDVAGEDVLTPLFEQRQQLLLSLPLDKLQDRKLPTQLTQKLSELWTQDDELTQLAGQQQKAVAEALKLFRKSQSGAKAYQDISNRRT